LPAGVLPVGFATPRGGDFNLRIDTIHIGAGGVSEGEVRELFSRVAREEAERRRMGLTS